jgi:phosphate transport system permease protein
MSKNKNQFTDKLITILTFLSAFAIILLAGGIFLTLMYESLPAIKKFGVFSFLTSTNWDTINEEFGAGSGIFGTIVTTTLALIFATPVSLGIAIFVTEIAPNSLRNFIALSIELLAAIPSIIYGMWGLYTLSPLMAKYIEPSLQNSFGKIPLIGIVFSGTPLGIDILTAAMVLGVMIIPFSSSIARDSFLLTPNVVKESSYALGATKWEMITDVVIPYSKSGVIGGIFLSLGRALGETMALAFVLGNKHKIPSSLLDAADTITVTLANEFAEAHGEIYLSSLFFLALILFFISFTILALSKTILRISRRKF